MLGKLNLFLICLQCFKLLEKTTNNFLSCVAVAAFLLIDITGSIEYNRTRDYEVREHIPVPHDNLFQSILSFAPLFLDSSPWPRGLWSEDQMSL